MEIMISKVFNTIEESATLAINQNIKSMRQEGKKLYHLGFGESPFPVPEIVKAGLRRGEDIKSYQPTQGIPELRVNVSEFYKKWFNLNYLPGDIFIGPGSKELIFDLMLLLEGDLILPVPSWVSYIPQAKLAHKQVVKVPTTIENSYCMTAEDLEKAYNTALKKGLNPHLMLINTPGNPCGNSYNEKTVKEITDFARKHKILLISDEIYGNITFEGYKHTSFAKFYPEGTFVTGGISKDRSLGGYRLGVCLVPEGQKELKKAFNTLISETFSCVSAPVQYAALNAFSTGPEMTNFINDCTAIHGIVLNYFFNAIMKSSVIECSPPMGAFYVYPKFNLKKFKSSKQVARTLLTDYNVASLPSSCFGQDESELNLRLAITDYSGSKALDGFRKNPDQDYKKFIQENCPDIVEAAKIILRFAKENA
jgi:aspartate aminotransferase